MTTAAPPRPSATILVLRDDPFEVLMIERHAAQDFSSALVFPGGVVDPGDGDESWLPHLTGAEDLSQQERALRIAAYRETFEETGLLLARLRDGTAIPEDRADIADFAAIVRHYDAVLALDDLVHFAHWITPEGNTKRYDTHFFLAAAPERHAVCCDGNEAVEAVWVRPAQALEHAASGARKIVFPTRMNLSVLARHADRADAMAVARQSTVHTVLPRVEKRENGIAVVIPTHAGYDQTEDFRPAR
ncbi:NUDIX hydrolase [Novosphingobium cyanobacteriorum]|uniref:NUDIX hydrolase n=1 Tax=Novosphingobium cyanobacteriorum TaxID=3024215 RepID=A0ABT6CN11_9SPHN|nr:NUDIX hydrolase [Novosphingobium cyanobacteriorum]MDF8335300.1 NUDIX hydrolase [Novosphingobium cyanobacteriorum]